MVNVEKVYHNSHYFASDSMVTVQLPELVLLLAVIIKVKPHLQKEEDNEKMQLTDHKLSCKSHNAEWWFRSNLSSYLKLSEESWVPVGFVDVFWQPP